ncbi:hypothetical protein [Methanomassiliicoccus luminyensis]|uniref:hypothetical protein n=1 Tax=Methanomassiliicoccus luminyensis TaxID=1080712 RepID=UPI0004748EA4|nr:hypothetical protein [Methanomassiliicoccus luminyensis]
MTARFRRSLCLLVERMAFFAVVHRMGPLREPIQRPYRQMLDDGRFLEGGGEIAGEGYGRLFQNAVVNGRWTSQGELDPRADEQRGEA